MTSSSIAFLSVSSLRLQPVTRLTNFALRKARASEPPISPTPIIER